MYSNRSNDLIFESYATQRLNESVNRYRLPFSGLGKFSDFYLVELINAKLSTQTDLSSHISGHVKSLRNDLVAKLGAFLLRYLKMACLVEAAHITNPEVFLEVGPGVMEIEDALYPIDNDLRKPVDEIAIALEKIANDAISEDGDTVDDIMEVAGVHDPEKYWDIIGPDDLRTIYTELPWIEYYGGKAWVDAVSETERLDHIYKRFIKTQNEDYSYKLIQFIDHIYDMQHNSGSLLNKSPQANVQKFILDLRAESNTAQLIQKLAPTSIVKNLSSRFFDRATKHETIPDDMDHKYANELKRLAVDYIKSKMADNLTTEDRIHFKLNDAPFFGEFTFFGKEIDHPLKVFNDPRNANILGYKTEDIQRQDDVAFVIADAIGYEYEVKIGPVSDTKYIIPKGYREYHDKKYLQNS